MGIKEMKKIIIALILFISLLVIVVDAGAGCTERRRVIIDGLKDGSGPREGPVAIECQGKVLLSNMLRFGQRWDLDGASLGPRIICNIANVYFTITKEEECAVYWKLQDEGIFYSKDGIKYELECTWN